MSLGQDLANFWAFIFSTVDAYSAGGLTGADCFGIDPITPPFPIRLTNVAGVINLELTDFLGASTQYISPIIVGSAGLSDWQTARTFKNSFLCPFYQPFYDYTNVRSGVWGKLLYASKWPALIAQLRYDLVSLSWAAPPSPYGRSIVFTYSAPVAGAGIDQVSIQTAIISCVLGYPASISASMSPSTVHITDESVGWLLDTVGDGICEYYNVNYNLGFTVIAPLSGDGLDGLQFMLFYAAGVPPGADALSALNALSDGLSELANTSHIVGQHTGNPYGGILKFPFTTPAHAIDIDSACGNVADSLTAMLKRQWFFHFKGFTVIPQGGVIIADNSINTE